MAVLPFEAPLWVFNRQACYGFTQKGKTGQRGGDIAYIGLPPVGNP